MKHILLPLLPVLLLLILGTVITACSSSNDSELNDLKSQIRDTKYELQSCKNSLDVYRGSSGSSKEETPSEPEAPAEPQYETVNVYHITVNGKETECLTRNEGSDDTPSCGLSFHNCKDGYTYRCLTNLKYKVTEEKRLVKEEEN